MERKQNIFSSLFSFKVSPRLCFWMYFSTQVGILLNSHNILSLWPNCHVSPPAARIPWISNWLMTTKVVRRRTRASLVTLNEWVFVCSSSSLLSQQEITYRRSHYVWPLFFAMHFFDWADICDCHAKPGICTLVTLSCGGRPKHLDCRETTKKSCFSSFKKDYIDWEAKTCVMI